MRSHLVIMLNRIPDVRKRKMNLDMIKNIDNQPLMIVSHDHSFSQFISNLQADDDDFFVNHDRIL